MPSAVSVLALLISFISTFVVLPLWIRRANRAKLTGKDVNKWDKPLVAELGGLCVIAGFLLGILAYVALRVFVYQNKEDLVYIVACISSILIATIIGLVDDILGWKIGLRIRYKILATLLIGLPIIVINAGHSDITLPLLGTIELGIIYPLLLIPIGIMGTSNGFNMLAGFNGLEAGQGVIILSTLGVIAYLIGNSFVGVIAFCMVCALLAFLCYNWYPAQIFPGDTMTYSVGALITIVAVLANIEKFAVILFGLYYLELILKMRGKFDKESFGKPQKDGSIIEPYKKWYGLEHIAIYCIEKYKKKAYEWEVVTFILVVQSILALSTVSYFILTFF